MAVAKEDEERVLKGVCEEEQLDASHCKYHAVSQSCASVLPSFPPLYAIVEGTPYA